MDFLFFLNAVLFGIALAMDAFSISLANGLNHPRITAKTVLLVAGTFAGFQILMPLLGWLLVHTAVTLFSRLQPFIPWIAMAVLLVLGIKMILDGRKEKRNPEAEKKPLRAGLIVLQGVATSIDALSVGFTIAEFSFPEALVESLIIGAVTFAICTAGLFIGRRFGVRLAWKASVLGGCILLAIGLEILLSGLLR